MSLELDPKSEKSFVRKWRTLSAMGKEPEAHDCLEEGLKTIPNSDLLRKHIKLEIPFGKPSQEFRVEKMLPEQNSMAERLRKQANAMFNRGDLLGARLKYSKGIELLQALSKDCDDENIETRDNLLLACLYSNRAIVHYREKEYAISIRDCDHSIELHPESQKPYVRKARALVQLQQRQEAMLTLEEGMRKAEQTERIHEFLQGLPDTFDSDAICDKSPKSVEESEEVEAKALQENETRTPATASGEDLLPSKNDENDASRSCLGAKNASMVTVDCRREPCSKPFEESVSKSSDACGILQRTFDDQSSVEKTHDIGCEKPELTRQHAKTLVLELSFALAIDMVATI